VDIDGDGLLDLVLGREDAGLVAYRNTGTRTAPHFELLNDFAIATAPFSAPAFADIDGNHRVDLFAGTQGGGVMFFRNLQPLR
jgi:hypothetical protein